MQRVLSFPSQSNRRFGDPSEFVSKRMCFSFMFSIAFLAVLAGFLLGRFVFDQELELSKAKLRKANENKLMTPLYKSIPEPNATTLLGHISESSLQQHLRSLRDLPDDSLDEAKFVKSYMEDAGFDLISPLIDSNINLSFPSALHANEILLHGSGLESLRFNDSRSGSMAKDGYHTNKTVTGNIIYVNFGRHDDYYRLEDLGFTVKDSIVLARVGRIRPLDIVNIAFDFEAAGLILFQDPQQEDAKTDILTSADLGGLNSLNGDEAVPILCITSEDAEKLFRTISEQNESLSETWWSELNSSYPIGTGIIASEDRKIQIRVNTVTVTRKVYDIFGAIRGKLEPDRFVVIAHEREQTEKSDESTAIVLELIKTLGVLKNSKGWRPNRSIVIASWGTANGDHSLAEKWWSLLKMKTVAYLKIDSTYSGYGSVSARGTPLLENVFREAALGSNLKNLEMKIILKPGTDAHLVENGIPFLEVTLNERNTTKTMKEATTFWGFLIWKLAQRNALPFNLNSYMTFFNHSVKILTERFDSISPSLPYGLSKDSFLDAMQRLISAIASFQSKWSIMDSSKLADMRIMNDQYVQFSNALSCSDKSGFQNYYRHPIFSQGARGTDAKAGFGILQDFISDTLSTETPDDLYIEIVNHLNRLEECINAARYALTDGLRHLLGID